MAQVHTSVRPLAFQPDKHGMLKPAPPSLQKLRMDGTSSASPRAALSPANYDLERMGHWAQKKMIGRVAFSAARKCSTYLRQ